MSNVEQEPQTAAADSPGTGTKGGDASTIRRQAASYEDEQMDLVALMWLGRLEIVPIVVLVSRHYWRNA